MGSGIGYVQDGICRAIKRQMTIKLFILTFLTTISSLTLLAQSKDTWTSFWNKDSTLIGYKDNHGVVKIEPKFTGLTNARKFDNILAVSEESNGNWSSYYLIEMEKLSSQQFIMS